MVYCALCTAPHLTSQHDLLAAKKLLDSNVDIPHCINCFAAGLSHAHNATGKDCPFFIECNNHNNLTGLLNLIWDHHMEGHPNPFGATRVHSVDTSKHSHSSAPLSSQGAPPHPAHIDDYYPHHPLFNPSLTTAKPTPYGLASQVLPSSESSTSMKLTSSGDLPMDASA